MSDIFPYEQYSEFSKRLAKNYSKDYLEKEYEKYCKNTVKYSSKSNINDRTYLYSQARAHKFNAMTGNYENKCHYKWALEIYEFYPEETKDAKIDK